jgi:hypothetical protein
MIRSKYLALTLLFWGGAARPSAAAPDESPPASPAAPEFFEAVLSVEGMT